MASVYVYLVVIQVVVLPTVANRCADVNCLACNNKRYNCYICNDTFYRYVDDQPNTAICAHCPPGCNKCTDSLHCSECKLGYYGKVCGYNCSLCINDLCSKDYCIDGCIDGYHQEILEGIGYCITCSFNCTKCSDRKRCEECQAGYQLTSTNTNETYCNPCYSGCKTCSSSGSCDSCPEGKWSEYCTKNCSDGCKDNTCERTTGACNTGCKDDYYMDTDNICYPCSQAPSKCFACQDGTYRFGSSCLTCSTGFGGSTCTEIIDTNTPSPSDSVVKPDTSGYIYGAIGGVLGTLTVVVAICMAIFMARRYIQRYRRTQRQPDSTEHIHCVIVPQFVEGEANQYDNISESQLQNEDQETAVNFTGVDNATGTDGHTYENEAVTTYDDLHHGQEEENQYSAITKPEYENTTLEVHSNVQ